MTDDNKIDDEIDYDKCIYCNSENLFMCCDMCREVICRDCYKSQAYGERLKYEID